MILQVLLLGLLRDLDGLAIGRIAIWAVADCLLLFLLFLLGGRAVTGTAGTASILRLGCVLAVPALVLVLLVVLVLVVSILAVLALAMPAVALLALPSVGFLAGNGGARYCRQGPAREAP